MSFYVYATSAARYPENTQSDFKFYLPHSIHLDSQYYCGLSEIHLANNQTPLPYHKDREIKWSYGENEVELEKNAITFHLPKRFYKNVDDLVTTLNTYMSEYVSEIDHLPDVENYVTFIYYDQYHKLYSSCSNSIPNQHLKFSKSLSTILGFPHGEWTKITHELSKFNVNFTPAVSNLYVVTNLTEPERVGGEMLPLLRQVVTSSENVGAYISLTFNPCHYKKVRLRDLSFISIQILDESGNLVEFEGSGEVICVLHFIPENKV